MSGEPTGEPYRLTSKRLVFTTWYWIRPGSFGWYDAQDRNVAVAGDQGPWGAGFRGQDVAYGIRLVAQPAERVGPLVAPSQPWEDKGLSLSTLIHENDLYRGWGTASSSQGGARFCYLESPDGLHWDRPALGQVDLAGQRANNLLDSPGGTVFLDPDAPADERFKWVDLKEITREEFETYRRRWPEAWESRVERSDVQQIFGVCGATSPDGLHWTTLPEPLVLEHSDTQLVAYYDVRLRRYVLYTRAWRVGVRAQDVAQDLGITWISPGRRAIGRSESADFRHMPLSEIILEPGPERPPSDVLYTNCRTTIPGAPEQHLMFPTIWHMADDTTSIALAASVEGKVWHFLLGAPLLSTAPFGQWDGGAIFAHPNLVELADGRWALPYTGYTFPHKYPRGQLRFAPGYAVWPHGRLVAVEAVERGAFATVALLPPGRRLCLNAITQRAGSVRVEVAGLDGKPLPGRAFADATPIIGDQPRAPLSWHGETDLGHTEDHAILLRLRLERARVFGLDFE